MITARKDTVLVDPRAILAHLVLFLFCENIRSLGTKISKNEENETSPEPASAGLSLPEVTGFPGAFAKTPNLFNK